MNDVINFTSIDADVVSRAHDVSNKLMKCQRDMVDGYLDMCELLLEAQDNAYHTVYNYTRFGDWIEQGSELGISARQAYYYVNLARKAAVIGANRQQLLDAGITKLKEIFTLEPKEHAEDMRRLLTEAGTNNTYTEIKSKVAAIKKKSGVAESDYLVLKFDPAVRATVEQALMCAKFNYGEMADEEGEVQEASISKCMEIICLSYLQDPNNTQEFLAP